MVATASSVGAGFTAKVGCSLGWNSGEDVEDLLRSYIAPEAAPLGPLLGVTKTADGAEGRAWWGLVRARAICRPGLGCTLLRGAARHWSQALPAIGGQVLPRGIYQIDSYRT